ncbi:MAG: hypothetical protein F6K41_27120 [Symploca sp. SIO3E6]|nr:hypothetical protein [Caldora sp. SIO3E6]
MHKMFTSSILNSLLKCYSNYISSQLPGFIKEESILKKAITSGFTALTVMGLTISTAQTTLARDSIKFFCDTSQANPVMKLRVPEGEISFIRWEDKYFEQYITREERCREIAQRFQKAQQAGTLDYMSHGYFGDSPAICIPHYLGSGTCKDLLITLKPEYSDPSKRQELIEHLWLIGTRGGIVRSVLLTTGSLVEDGSSIDIEKWLFGIRAWLQEQNAELEE